MKLPHTILTLCFHEFFKRYFVVAFAQTNFFKHVITSSCFIGAFCDLVWSDPEEVDSWAVSPRGAGWLFGQSVTNDFMNTNHLKLICRAHQLVHEGMFANHLFKKDTA